VKGKYRQGEILKRNATLRFEHLRKWWGQEWIKEDLGPGAVGKRRKLGTPHFLCLVRGGRAVMQTEGRSPEG